MGGSKPSGSSTTTTVQQADPWEGQQSYLSAGFKHASDQYGDPNKPQFFPGSTVTPYSAETEQALKMRTDQANDPNSLVNQASAETGKTLSGEYYQPGNPAFDAMMTGISRQVAPGVDTAFSSSGRFGSPLHAEAMSRGITQGMLPYVAAERGRQYQSSLDAGTTSQYAPELLGSVGAARENMSRQELQEDIDRHNFNQTVEANKLKEYMGLITGNYGGTTNATTQQPYFSNAGQSALGMGTGLAGIGTSLFAPAGGGGIVSGNK